MNFPKIFLSILTAYVALVLLAEFAIWKLQPAMEGGVTVSIDTDSEGRLERHLASYEFDGKLYVSSNHWFRSWYYAAINNPIIELIHNDKTQLRRAVAVTGSEYQKVKEEYKMGFILRLICGFAPSKFLRLEEINPVNLSAPSY